MINRYRSMPARPWAAAAAAALTLALALAALAGVPDTAIAASRCQEYCSAPGKNYKDCMEQCIEREDPRAAERGIRELCRSRGHDELECLREHGLADGPPAYPPPAYGAPPAYAPPPPPPYQQPIQCYRDQYGRTVCPP